MQNHKRLFRFLLSLCLVFGCCLSFSSVSFADNSPFTVSGWTETKAPKGDFADSVSTTFTLTLGDNVINSTWYEHHPNVVNDIYHVSVEAPLFIRAFFTNNSDTDVYLSTVAIKDLAFGTTNTLTNGSLSWYVKDIRSTLGNASITYVGGGQINMPYATDYNYKGNLVVPANSTISFNFEVMLYAPQIISYSDTLRQFGSTFLQGFSIIDYRAYPIPAGEFVSPDIVDRETLGAIETQSQQQQQQHQEQMDQSQQQHEEQMQQQQEQYEDLTDPAPEAGSDLVGGTEDEVKEKIGLFTFIDDLIQSMLGLFVPPEEDPVITFPGWSITIQGVSYQIWEDHTFNLASLDGDFSVLMTAVRFATIAVVYAAFLKFLVDTYNRIILGSDGD